MPVSFDEVRRMALALPEAREGTWYGTPGFHVRRKYFLRLRDDGETIVLRINFFERGYLLEAEPDAFFIIDHYRDYPAVLARLAALTPARLREHIEDAWRMVAPKRLVDEFDRRPSG